MCQKDKIDIVKLETTPVDLSKLSNVVKNDVVKKTEYNELVKNVNNINTTDTSNLVSKNWLQHNRRSFASRLPQASLASKNDIASFVKNDRF